MATLSPPSLTSILAANTAASKSQPTVSQPTAASSGSSSSGMTREQIAESNKAKLAENRALRAITRGAEGAIDASLAGLGADITAVTSGNTSAPLSPYLSSYSGATTAGELRKGIQSGAIKSPVSSINKPSISTPTYVPPTIKTEKTTNVPTQVESMITSETKTGLDGEPTGLLSDEEERKRIAELNRQKLLENKQKRAEMAQAEADKKAADAEEARQDEFKATTEGKFLTEQGQFAKQQKEEYDRQAAALKEAQKPTQDLITEYDTQIGSIQNEADTYAREQEELMKQYEGNRLNQVRGQLISALAARGVNIANLTPEQLLQLSGDVGSKAFTDVFQAKERTKNNIDARRRDASTKVAALRQQKIITDQQYRSKIAEIDSYANSQKMAIDDSYSKLFYNVMTTSEQNKKTEQQTALSNLLTIAKDAGLTGTSLSSIANIVNKANSSPEAIRMFYTSLSDPNSLIAQRIREAESAAKASALAAAALKQYEAETDRLKAEASMTSATRPRSSGTNTTVTAF